MLTNVWIFSFLIVQFLKYFPPLLSIFSPAQLVLTCQFSSMAYNRGPSGKEILVLTLLLAYVLRIEKGCFLFFVKSKLSWGYKSLKAYLSTSNVVSELSKYGTHQEGL